MGYYNKIPGQMRVDKPQYVTLNGENDIGLEKEVLRKPKCSLCTFMMER